QNHKNIFFQKIWHELLDYDILKYKYKLAASPVPVHHYPGEINQVDIKEKRKFYLRLGRKKAALDPNDCQAQWELAVAEHIAGNHGRAYKACLLSLRNGIYGSDRLYFLAALARAKGGVKEHRLIFEKAVCKTYPNLTHINPADKTPLHEAPKKPGPPNLIRERPAHVPAPDWPKINIPTGFIDPMGLINGQRPREKDYDMHLTPGPKEEFVNQPPLQKKPKKRIKHHAKKPSKKVLTK
ncbi:MAG: hypothetical protein KAX15_04945, partial [Candidatus Omnitrophica bacterium]|nr:hypothetical protein [Candidatus Omnitrophota bacterium]